MKKISKKFKLLNKIVIVLLLALTLMQANTAFALTAAQKQAQAQLDYYNAKAAETKRLADLKKQEAAQVQQQITVVNQNINQTESALSVTATQMDSTQAQIDGLIAQIKTEEDNLTKEKSKLNDVLVSRYMEGESDLFAMVLSSDNLSDIITQQQYYDSVSQQIDATMEKIKKMKEELSVKKAEQDTRLSDLTALKTDQLEQKGYLANQANYKQKLLTNATSAMADYKAQQQQAETKASEMRALLATTYGGSNTPQGSQLVSSIDSSWYYNQRDYSTVLRPSTLTIAEVGCYITSMAMIATYHRKGKTPPDIAAVSDFDYDGSWNWFTGYSGISAPQFRSLNWGLVNSELDNGYPVIASVYTGFGKAYNGDGSNHFIVIKGYSDGKYLIHDPYWRNGSYDLSDVRSIRIVRPQ